MDILALNKIAACGTDRLGAGYTVSDAATEPVGVLVRSASMHEMALPESLLAIARAGAGVNNIPLVPCAEAGVGKQQPDIYEQTLALSGCTKEDTVIFEDALHAIRTAKGAGFRLAAIHDPALTESHAEIRRLADWYVETYETL